MIVRACQPTRSSTVGSTSRSEATSQSSTKTGISGACPASSCASDPGRNGFHPESAQAASAPTKTRKISVWLM